MDDNANADERGVLKSILDDLHQLNDEARMRVLRTVETFYGFSASVTATNGATLDHVLASSREPQFSNRTELTPKEFVFQKAPKTDIERVVCLAYFLTHYRSQPHFKTIDISKLNTEAAQLKFSNASAAVENAAAAGLLASAGKGNKQLSASGERYVDVLPDRDAAKDVFVSIRKRRSRKKATNGKSPANHKA